MPFFCYPPNQCNSETNFPKCTSPTPYSDTCYFWPLRFPSTDLPFPTPAVAFVISTTSGEEEARRACSEVPSSDMIDGRRGAFGVPAEVASGVPLDGRGEDLSNCEDHSGWGLAMEVSGDSESDMV